MNLQNRIEVMAGLGEYLQKNNEEWQSIKQTATQKNPWFTEEFINKATGAITDQFLNKEKLINKTLGNLHYVRKEVKGVYHKSDTLTPCCGDANTPPVPPSEIGTITTTSPCSYCPSEIGRAHV